MSVPLPVVAGDGSGGDVATGLLWSSTGASVFLPALIVVRTGYDVVDRLRLPRATGGRAGGGTAVDVVFGAVEVGLAVIVLTVIGFYGYLVVAQPDGRGAGAVAVGVVVVASVSVLLSVSVLAQGVATYARFTAEDGGAA